MPVSPQPTPKPSLPLALVAATIAGAFDRRWLGRPIVALAEEHDVSAERVSRLRARLQPGFEEAVAEATRRGRPPTVELQVAPDPVTEDLLAIAASVIREVRVPRRAAERLVAGARRLRDQRGLTQQDFCARLGIPDRTFRFWKRRVPAPPTPAPTPPPLTAPKPDRHEGRFGLDVTLPGIQTMSDTTPCNLFGVDLQVTAAMDPGNRHRQPWEAFAVEAAETAETISDTIGRAVAERSGTQVITDQGKPFLADLSRAAYDAVHADHAPCAEGAPTQKAPIERSFGLVKRLLEPIAELTRKLAELVPALRRDDIARPVAALLLATYLRVFELGHRDRPHPLEGADPQLLRDIAEEQREKAHHEMESKRLLLGEIYDGLGCAGSRERFIRSFRHHHLDDIQAAQRLLVQNWHCCCRIYAPERAFAWQIWKTAEYGDRQRRAAHARRRADAQRDQDRRADLACENFLATHPEELLCRGLDLVVTQSRTDLGRELLRARRGPGSTTVARAVDLLRISQPAVYVDVVEATWRAWTASGDPRLASSVPVARQVLNGCLNPATATAPLTLPDLSEMLRVRASKSIPRPSPDLRNCPAGFRGSG
jgi:hypothetical protein